MPFWRSMAQDAGENVSAPGLPARGQEISACAPVSELAEQPERGQPVLGARKSDYVHCRLNYYEFVIPFLLFSESSITILRRVVGP